MLLVSHETSPLIEICTQKKLDLVKIYQLSTAFEIAKKISFQKQKSYTRFIVRLSIAATAISVAAILLTLSIVNGFQESIAGKVYSFWGQIRISSVSGEPLLHNQQTIHAIEQLPNVKSVTPFITQSTVLSYGQEIEGVMAKGNPSEVPIPFLSKGNKIRTSSNDSINNQIIISDILATKLNIPLDSFVRLYFINNGAVQQRKLKVVGFYHSGMDDYDKQFVLMDLKNLQQISKAPNYVEGYTISLVSNESIDATNDSLQKMLPENWVATTISNYYPQIFDWIGVQTINRNVTVTILLIIAIVNLLTCLFILMLERIPMIGTLTAMGAGQNLIRQIFLYQASFICWMGIGIGAFIGIGIGLLQQQFGFIQLDEAAYFIKALPIKMNLLQIGMVIIGTALVSYVSFLIPTLWIKKISPAKAVQFN
jgi:lipoprotein-releasing system permease protein